jgi:hypothetical protein
MRRRQLVDLVYDGRFELSTELQSVTSPLAMRVAALDNPAIASAAVGEVADAAHDLCSTIVSWLAEEPARKATEHMSAPNQAGARQRACKLITDNAPRPALPDIDTEALRRATWPALLARMAAPLNVGLSDLLARSLPPDSPVLRGRPSRSEMLVDLLRDFDRAASLLGHRLNAHARRPAPPPPKPTPREQLVALGVDVDAMERSAP